MVGKPVGAIMIVVVVPIGLLDWYDVVVVGVVMLLSCGCSCHGCYC